MGANKMKHATHVLVAIVVLAVWAGAAPAGVEKSETIEKSFTLSDTGSGRLVVVDNVWGSIRVTGHSGDRVEMVARKTIEARSTDEYERALKEAFLDITEEDGYLELFVDGPFRGDTSRRHKSRRWRDREYRVYYEFELKVPEGADIDVSSVNDGAIRVSGISGDYQVHHVNDDIMMEDISGSGEVYTVNGDVTLRFADNPGGDCRFGSLNGEVTMYFKPGLSADFHLETFNGDFFTDFDLDYVPSVQFAEVESNGETIYRAGHTTVVRAGRGGPEIRLDGFNGDMYILEKR
jgi:hypothetical protein